MVLWLAVLGVALCLRCSSCTPRLRGGWVQGALAGITLAMSVLPEEFAVVLTVFLALGAWRLSRQGVLTRSMPAIEALGAATVLAVDKTGTLTENRMVVSVLDDGVVRLVLDGRRDALDHGMRELLGAALAACEIQAFDPMERAIAAAARQHAPRYAESLGRMSLVHEYELTADLLAVTHVWKDAASDRLLIATKGAPEAIAGLCRLDAAGGRPPARTRRGNRALTASGCWRSHAPNSPVERRRRHHAKSISASSGWSDCAIRYVRPCPRRSRIAIAPASAS